jgi:predicted RNA-binding protein
MKECIGGTGWKTRPFLDELISEDVKFLEVSESDVMDSEEEADGREEVLVVYLEFIFRSHCC